jgi:hypothetical protein
MSRIDKVAPGAQVKKSFGGIEMLRQATVQLSPMNLGNNYSLVR